MRPGFGGIQRHVRFDPSCILCCEVGMRLYRRQEVGPFTDNLLPALTEDFYGFEGCVIIGNQCMVLNCKLFRNI